LLVAQIGKHTDRQDQSAADPHFLSGHTSLRRGW
jgi:hypothetical protein